MKVAIFLFFMTFVLFKESNSQDKIVYHFEDDVSDSLEKGVAFYQKLNGISEEHLKLILVIINCDVQYHLYLEDFTDLTDGGFKKLINASYRFMQTKTGKLIPIIFPSDVFSQYSKEQKMASIPLSGYYLRVDSKAEKVLETAILF